jgi:ADP-heptose:LPS heptosyltransferase
VDRSQHQIHDADALLAALQLDAIDPSWRPTLPDDLKDAGESMVREAGINRHNAVGLAPSTARGAAKRWPGRCYGEFARRLRALGHEPVVVVGPGENEIAEEVSAAAGADLPVLGGGTDVAGLAAVIAGLRVLVANDSGPMQLAARLGTPVVGIFGPTDPDRTAPVGPGQRVVSPQPGRGTGMQWVSVDQVQAAALELFAEVDLKPRGRLVR